MDNKGNDLGYPVKMRLGVLTKGLLAGLPADELVALLSMAHVPGQWAPFRTSLKEGVSIRPGHVLQVAYNQIPSNYNAFLYDWRADLRWNAQQLIEFMTQRKPQDGRWNLVGHSQGALIIILASKLLPSPLRWDELVASVTLVGAPIAGTVNAAAALLNGDQMGPAGVDAFRKILRTWPALYQMLPSWPVLLDANGDALPPEQQITQEAGWPGIDGIDPDLLLRARETQPLLRDPFGAMGDIRVTVLLGRNRNTTINLLASNPLTSNPAKQQLGDTLVPHDQTLAWLGGHFAQFVLTYPSPCNVHAMLCDDPGVATRIKTLAVN